MNDELTVHINENGYQQYRDVQGHDVCPNCGEHYTNEGEGVLCECVEEEDHV